MPPRKKKTPISEPSEFELQILSIFWDHGKCTAREVLEHLDDGKDRAYTSVLSVMQVMQKKGLIDLTGQRKKLAYVYHAKVTRRQIMGPRLKGLVQKVFGGSSFEAAMQLMNANDVSNDELDEMEAWIKSTRKTKKK
ncbi:BlaI/MecI/CopY family transcriptional regulator [Planctomycetota bacterium]|nr:BlaI/MecI/CopY family transcriptional regulator [Planctomycetota bacterium]